MLSFERSLTCGGDNGKDFLQRGQQCGLVSLPDVLQKCANFSHLMYILSQLLLLGGTAVKVADGPHQLLAEQIARFLPRDALHKI